MSKGIALMETSEARHVIYSVEIFIVRRPPHAPEKRYPLRGQPVQYDRPFESVAEADWEAR